MTDEFDQDCPENYRRIAEKTRRAGFTMASDVLTCSLLRTLAASKPSGKFLELGTGTGLSTCWILDGMDEDSTLQSIDNDPVFLEMAREELGADHRLNLVLEDGGAWIDENLDKRFDFIFADSWHGKYLMLDPVLAMLNRGGLYIIDDMLPQSNWPAGHVEKAERLVAYLETREDLIMTKQVWSTGIIVAAKHRNAKGSPGSL